jgi:hypothetical protein
MPMTFTDEMVVRWARMRGIKLDPRETLRERLADATQSSDPIEAQEIRTGKPWDKMDPVEILAGYLNRKG